MAVLHCKVSPERELEWKNGTWEQITWKLAKALLYNSHITFCDEAALLLLTAKNCTGHGGPFPPCHLLRYGTNLMLPGFDN